MRGLGFSGGVELWERELRGGAALKGRTDRLDRPIRALGIWPVRWRVFFSYMGALRLLPPVFSNRRGRGKWGHGLTEFFALGLSAPPRPAYAGPQA